MYGRRFDRLRRRRSKDSFHAGGIFQTAANEVDQLPEGVEEKRGGRVSKMPRSLPVAAEEGEGESARVCLPTLRLADIGVDD